MDVVDAAPPLGAWASIRGYFTPATLFLVVNLVIGTIALTSRAATQQRRRRERYYQYHDDAHLHQDPHMQQQQQHPEYQHHHYYPQEQAMYAPPPAPLARTSSVLDRLRSLGLYRFRSDDFPPEYGAAPGPPNHAQDAFAPVEEEAHHARSLSEPAPAPAREERRPPASRMSKSGSEARKSQVKQAPARVVEAVAENDYVEARTEDAVRSFRREEEPSPLQQEYHHYQEEYVPPVRAPAPAPLQRTSSVLDRLRSLGLYGFLAPEQPAAASIPASDAGFGATLVDEKKHAHAHYDRSRSEPAPEQGKKEKKQEAKSRMAKSSSAARQTAAPTLAASGGSVDARAEAFIDSFRQQQVEHYHEEEHVVPPPAPAPLSRTSSVLDRLRSFGLYRFRSGDLGPDLPAAAAETSTPAADEKKHAAQYGRSRSEPPREQGKKEPRMSKSSSSVVEEEPEPEQGVDARADDFINKFRQQLQLQRLNSLLNYKEMLNRGKQ